MTISWEGRHELKVGLYCGEVSAVSLLCFITKENFDPVGLVILSAKSLPYYIGGKL